MQSLTTPLGVFGLRYCPGMTFDEGLDTLLEHEENLDTHRAVVALANLLDYHGGREKLEGIGWRPQTEY